MATQYIVQYKKRNNSKQVNINFFSCCSHALQKNMFLLSPRSLIKTVEYTCSRLVKMVNILPVPIQVPPKRLCPIILHLPLIIRSISVQSRPHIMCVCWRKCYVASSPWPLPPTPPHGRIRVSGRRYQRRSLLGPALITSRTKGSKWRKDMKLK